VHQLFRILRDPTRLRRAIASRLRAMPFRLGLASAWPGTYVSYVPDRYGVNDPAYRARGGMMRPAFLKKFFQGNGANNRGDLPRFYFLGLVIDQIVKEKIKGDIAEVGVYKGNTASLLAELARRMGCTAYLFDTFQGFSEKDIVGVDAHVNSHAFSDTSLAAVRALVGDQNVRFLPGHFPETAAGMPGDTVFSLVHIDCDLYAPFHAALHYFYPRLAPGGFLIMHDYSSLYWDGAEKAADEFFADKPEKLIPVPDKSGTVVIRKMQARPAIPSNQLGGE